MAPISTLYPSEWRFGDWWVEITTQKPACLYYFGPFSLSQEAEQMGPQYVEDLAQEGANGIMVVIKQCYPSTLTVPL
ncbi:MAG: DUF1816 domain-containing protein [Leptolyngbya sp. RL_3_1]|nr:DUF1816 domain-containing protein [Leptolyngbya sp. RL_3_1]